MSTFAKVLLATDLTPQSDNLTECLFSLCPDTETQVVLAHVFDDADDADAGSAAYKKVMSRLEGYKNDLLQAGYEDIGIATPVGEPFEAICQAAEQCEADLIMAASHGKGFLKSAIMGSTTFDLARAATLPLFISKDEDQRYSDKLLTNVMIPTDFSKKSLSALNIVRGLREHVDKIIFVHVIERSRSRQDYKDKYNNAALFLQELVDEMKIFGIDADYRIAKGAASKEIVHLARQEHTKLIMMTKTGAGLVKGLVIGSTSQNVILNTDCATLLLPAEDIADE